MWSSTMIKLGHALVIPYNANALPTKCDHTRVRHHAHSVLQPQSLGIPLYELTCATYSSFCLKAAKKVTRDPQSLF